LNERVVTRVIGCQGSIQLVTATNVVIRRTQLGTRYHNILLVYDLYTPPGQDLSFFQFIKKMAGLGPLPFGKIIYLSPPTIAQLEEIYRIRGKKLARDYLRTVTGIEAADELFLCSNWQLGNNLLMHCYDSSEKICYGDSIGLHIPEGYFADQSFTQKLRRFSTVRKLLDWSKAFRLLLRNPKQRPLMTNLLPQKFSSGYYLTTKLTKEKPAWPYEFTDKQSLVQTFQSFSAAVDFDGHGLQANRTAILVTTNFSESRKMTLGNEIDAYLQFVKRNTEPGITIIIKPHPRDSPEKLKRLQNELNKLYKVQLLSRVDDYYTPFELFLFKINSEILPQIRYLTFSTACLSIKLLFSRNVNVGFGTDLVDSYFNNAAKPSRIKHEDDLNNLLALIDASGDA
jgi:hypothetical protein